MHNEWIAQVVREEGAAVEDEQKVEQPQEETPEPRPEQPAGEGAEPVAEESVGETVEAKPVAEEPTGESAELAAEPAPAGEPAEPAESAPSSEAESEQPEGKAPVAIEDSADSVAAPTAETSADPTADPATSPALETSASPAADSARPRSRRWLVAAAAVVVVIAIVAGTFALGFGHDAATDVAEYWTQLAQEQLNEGTAEETDGNDTSDDAEEIESDDDSFASATAEVDASALPGSYDLRDPNGDGDRSDSVVTPVKSQGAWGTCWGFASIAACETSILSEVGLTAADTDLDLSELQLAVSAAKAVPDENNSQAGEGYHNDSTDPNAALMAGGVYGYTSATFAAGIGPLFESDAPYQNKEGVKLCGVVYAGEDPEEGGDLQYLTDEEIETLRAGGAEVSEYSWAGNYQDDEGDTHYTDWSVDDSLWNQTVAELENANVLPDTVVKNEDGSYKETDFDAVNNIKDEIYTYGRAVAIAFCADTSLADQNSVAKYINDNWAHFTYEDTTENENAAANHGVTIVGWDDSYSRENFSNPENKLPEGDGAWLVKNSWGASTEDFPNNGSWGIVEDGQNTGYFWLSYYDRSISMIESFDFDLNDYSDTDGDTAEYYIDQYDYLPQMSCLVSATENKVSSANIFTAEGDEAIRTLSCATYVPGTTVTYQVYLLDDEATSPTDPDHSEWVLAVEENYRYAGYHRSTLEKEDWVKVSKGQRFAVVTTQLGPDGLYYQGVSINQGKKSKKAVETYTETVTKERHDYYYGLAYDAFYQGSIAEGMPEDDAAAESEQLAEEAVSEGGSFYDQMMQEINEKVEVYEKTYYESVVNAGESWTTNPEVDSEPDTAEWVDWTVLKDAVESQKWDGVNVVVDNAAIKAISEEQA